MAPPWKVGCARPAGAGLLAFVAAAGGLAVPGAGTAADAPALFVLLDAAMDVVRFS